MKLRDIMYDLGGRKFLAFVVATILFVLDKISFQAWIVAFSVFVGATAIEDATWKKSQGEGEIHYHFPEEKEDRKS